MSSKVIQLLKVVYCDALGHETVSFPCLVQRESPESLGLDGTIAFIRGIKDWQNVR